MRIVALGLLAIPLFCQDLGSIQGRVVNNATSVGFPGVTVTVRSRQDPPRAATSDNSGAFRITGLKYATYGISVQELEGYDVSIQGPAGGGIGVYGPNPVSLQVNMLPWNVLRGRVLHATGEPARGVCLNLRVAEDCTVFTNEAGAFVFRHVLPGTYTLTARPERPKGSSPRSEAEEVVTYFPYVIDRAQAERITVGSGVRLPEFEIRLRTSPVYRVRGVVLDSLGKPAPNATVTLLSPRGGQNAYGYGTGDSFLLGPAVAAKEATLEAAQDGTFEFPAVLPGEWRIQAEYNPRHDAVERDVEPSGGTLIVVTTSAIEDVRIQLADPFRLDQSLDWGTLRPPEGPSPPRARLVPVDGQPSPWPQNPGEVGSYDVLVPGRYRVVPPLFSPGVYVASVKAAGREVLGEEVNVQPGMAPLQIVFRPAGNVQGTVEDCEGGTVILVPDTKYLREKVGVIRTVRCDSSGTFKINTAIPGSYHIAAFRRVDSQALIGSLLDGELMSGAATVQVEEGNASAVRLTARLWQ